MPASETTHPWLFPETDASVLHLTHDHIATIRTLVGVWDIVETGAPGLVLPDGEELEDDELAPYVELFLNAATLSPFAGTIQNGLLSPDMPQDERGYLLEYIPDKDLRAQLTTQTEIPFEADAIDLALWAEASLRETGIDPKRPFGSSNVAKDMRPILDPDATLSRGEFTKLKRTRFSRMILMLQLFVQHAHLRPGEYWQTAEHGWQHVDEMRKVPKQLTEQEWVRQIETPFHQSEQGYCFDLKFFVFETKDPVDFSGNHAAMAARMALPKNYTREHYSAAPSYLLEKALLGLEHWPESTGDPQQSFFTHVAVRCCNACGDFQQAAALLERAGLTLPDPVIELSNPVASDESLWVNMTVTRRGLGQISDAEFTALFDMPLKGGGTLSDRVEQIDRGKEGYSCESYEAAYAQLRLMRMVLADRQA